MRTMLSGLRWRQTPLSKPAAAVLRLLAAATCVAALQTAARAQNFTWSEDFQGTAVNTRPVGWVGNAPFRALPDPAQSGNIVYGARETSTRQRAVGRGAQGEKAEGGSHSTLTNRWLTAARGFEYRGRFFRANEASHIGFTFFSQQPEGTREYLVAMWRGSMRLFGPELVADSRFVPQPGRWHRFAIRADEEGNATRVRVRFWIDGQSEPSTWQLDASDASTSRLAGGRIGIWAAGGAAYVDDLAVAGDVVLSADVTPPSITFSESGRDLAKTNAFSRDVRVDVDAVDGSGIASLAVTLDGAAFQSGDLIATERAHELRATAIDGAGNSATASLSLLIDKTPPAITVHNVASNALYADSVKPGVTVEDLTETTVTATLNGQPFTIGGTISEERAHTLIVTATDALGWTTTTAPIRFTIDRTAPAVAFLESGRVLQPGARNVLDHDARVQVQVADAAATVTITVDGQPYAAGTPITGEGAHTIRARVTDAAGNATDAEVGIVIDKTRPVITVTPIPPLTNKSVQPVITVDDATVTTVRATLDGEPFASGTVVDAERQHTLVVSATDEAGWTTALAPIVFTIDRTPPAIAFVAPVADAMFSTPRIVVTGDSGDSVSVVINGIAATLDGVLKTFTATIDLSEGGNTLTAIATDAAGNQTTITRAVRLDTRVPLLTVASPATNACLDATQVEVRGTVSDASGATVRVNGVAATVSETSWVATIPTPDETRVLFTIEASDAAGHTAIATVPVTIDRTRPTLELTESGAPLSDTITNRALAIFGRAIDADPSATVAMALDGQPYAPGTPITAEKAYILTAVASDCAGHASDARTVRFTIDRTPPVISSLTPANGATVGTKPAITGRLSEEATVTVDGTGETASVAGLDFTLSAALSEGANALTLVARDRAGNESRVPLAFTVKTIAPSIEITESGSSIAADALFNRAVTPVIRATDPQATITATLDGQPFVSGTPVSADGRHTLSATATDVLNRAANATATFTIDRTPPRVTITSPAANAAVTAASIEVRGTVDSDDVVRVLVNGVNATVSGTNFTATIPADSGPLSILATAFDRAGNAGSASVDVSRDENRIGILLTSPVDGLLTNRPTTVVAGQVLTSSAPRKVTVNGIELPVDAAGAFRKIDFPLVEGDNAITATTGGSSVTVHVTADLTAPALKVMADGLELADAARFATAPEIAVQATDNLPGGVATHLTVDGAAVANANALPFGGHSLTAIARDAAGNETRIDRAFVIGQSTAAIGCSIGNLDPASDTSVFGERVRVTGRANAEAVLINGTRAALAEGTFCADVTLAAGRNEVLLQCARADGTPTGESPVTLVLNRWLDPEITITSPAPGSVLTSNRITVSGTVGAGVVSGDVNGLPFTPAGGAFSVSDVAVAPGLNVISARARTASDRMSVATTRVVARTGAPQIAITSPLAGTGTGAATVDVTGTYLNVDPATIAIANSSVTTQPLSDTTGRFSASVAIASSTTITATGRSYAGASVSASVDVARVAAAPSISIAAPFDNASVASTTESMRVTGTFTAGDGAQVSVNGVPASVSGSSFTADVDLAAGSTTAIVARVNAADGSSATDAIRVIRFAAPLAVRETFPAANAADVDRGVAVVVLLSNVLDATTVTNAIRVADSANNAVAGDLFVDRDAITFAPHAPFRAGERYTVTIVSTLRDLAGGTLASAHAFGFTAATTAPATPPSIDQADAAGCLTAQTITGRTSVPGARVRLDVDGVSTTTIASAANAFTFNFTLSGQPGYHAVRVREIGSDGTLSPERALCLRVNCAAPQVLGATLDRGAKKLAIQFSKPMDAATVTIAFEPALIGATSWNASGDTATVTFEADLTSVTLKVTVPATARDRGGVALLSEFTRTFEPPTQGGAERGKGFVSGAVYDATNGRPLAGASIVILSREDGEGSLTDSRGRYALSLDEGAWTLRASATNYSTVWRQVIVPAGAGIVPIDIRLTRRGPEHVANGTPATLTHGGDTSVTRPVSLSLAAASLPNGARVRLTAIGAQSLAGLLPLGWAPLAAAEIVADDQAIPGARLTFGVGIPAGQTLSLVGYDDARDEWRVEVPVAATPSFDITKPGSYVLVYADAAPHLAHPPVPRAGAALAGVADPCIANPDACRLTGRSFTLDPKAVVPSGRSVATLITEGATQPYPSGTVVQAFIDEQLNLADGRVLVEPPFATDLIVHRTLAGDAGIADFHLAPSAQAATVVLRDGVEQIRIVDYPGRIARGTLLGAEGGRLPGGDGVTIDVPAGATLEPLHASVAPLDVASIGSVAGFRVVGGFTLTLTPASPVPIEGATLTLLKPVTATVSVTNASQVIIGELVTGTPFGTLIRLAAVTSPGQTVGGARLFTTREAVPVEGIVREGRYIVLAAEAPIAFAHGQVRAIDENGPAVANARVTANGIGVVDLTQTGGLFVVPVLAKPAAPFSLTPRTIATGNGATRVHPASPDPDAMIDAGALPLAAQPPHLVEVTPADNAALDATAAFVVQARFDAPIDPSSVAGGITVNDRTTGAALTGTVAAAGNVVTFNASTPLAAASSYAITIAPTIRATNGAPFGRTQATSFTTRAVPTGNTAIRPERIRITIPDSSGRSTITGAAGALPAGAQAIAVRRDRFFIASYTATVANDGSFTFDAGHQHPNDAIAFTDALDLRVLDPVSKAIIAVIPLTPFVSADGKSFLAPPDRESHFTTAEGIRVVVPEGAFGVATLVKVEPAAASVFDVVPGFTTDLRFAAGVSLEFDGVAQKRLEISIPAPANVDPSRSYFLGHLGMSSRGPRVMIVDLLRLDGSAFTTVLAETTIKGGRDAGLRVAADQVLSGREVRDFLLGATRPGQYGAVDFPHPIAWILMQGMNALHELFFDTMSSIFAAQYYVAERGKVLVPVLANKAFTVSGVDTTNGFTDFTRAYDALAPSDPAVAVNVPSPVDNVMGPYPVFALPGRVEIFDVNMEPLTDESRQNVVLTFDGGMARLRAGTPALPAGTRVEMINLNRPPAVSEPFDGLVEIPAQKGDRIVVVIGEKDVDPSTGISVTFSKPIFTGDGDAYLREIVKLRIKTPGDDSYSDVAAKVRADSGGRRVIVDLGADLQRGKLYQLALSRTIRDTAETPLTLAQRAGGTGLADDLRFEFSTRAPAGEIASFELPTGTVRDLAMSGNILFVSALEGGVYAYDASNPVAMGTSGPFARAEAPIGSASAPGQTWAVATDHHNRLFATAMSSTFGVVRSYRVEDFIAGGSVAPRANAIVSWRPGINVGLPVGTSYVTVSDRPEAVPRKVRIATQDENPYAVSWSELTSGATVIALDSSSTIFKATVGVARPPADFPYLRQRVTIVNKTSGFRWSLDVTRNGVTPPSEEKVTIVGRPTDEFEIVRNVATYAVVTLFGFGVGVYDVNAVESNRFAGETGVASYQALRERVLATEADEHPACDPTADPNAAPCDPAAAALDGQFCPIADLRFSSEAAVVPTSEELIVYGLDQNRGIVELHVRPPTDDAPAASCRRPNSLVLAERVNINGQLVPHAHPRLNRLRRLYRDASGGREPVARFTSIATYSDGARRYGLIAGRDYGLIVVELDPLVGIHQRSLADVVWIPAGAWAVRVFEEHRLAAVVDGKGRTLLVDLTRIDERDPNEGTIADCSSIECEWPLFPTVRAAIGGFTSQGGEVGVDDPRIVWKSGIPPDGLLTTLPPMVDPETGFLYRGDAGDATLRVVSAIDPKLRIVTEDPATGAVVPLRTLSPRGVPNVAAASTFRVQLTVPGSIAQSVAGGMLPLAIESERVSGAVVGDTPPGFPPAHIRNLPLVPQVPVSSDEAVTRLRYQRPWNRLTTQAVVAIADPRASKRYQWPDGADRTNDGCHHCDALAIEGAAEIFSAGHVFSIHVPEGALSGTPYAYLAEQGRLSTRVPTVPADTVRARSVQIPGRDRPIAEGAIEETVYVHSGEVATSAVDLIVEGRAGVDVVIDRSYLSRTIGTTPLGFGWTSSLFEHLRELPGGHVEYHDGAGEIWTFRKESNGYATPPGLTLKLVRTQNGWNVFDQQWNFTAFDVHGRLSARSDRFADPRAGGANGPGNTVRYLYDRTGRLAQIVDPLGRATTVHYNANDLVDEIEDWRRRKVAYRYENARLVAVKGPMTQDREIRYGYQPTGDGLTELVDIAANLTSIQDAAATVPRVMFEYDTSMNPPTRDRVKNQTWATGETARFDVTATGNQVPTEVAVTDALGQVRVYTLTAPFTFDGRRHVAKTEMPGVAVLELPATVAEAPLDLVPGPADQPLVREVLEREPDGRPKRVRLPHGQELLDVPEAAAGGAAGTRTKRRIETSGETSITTEFGYDDAEGARNNPVRVARASGTPEMAPEEAFRDAQSPSRNRRTVTRKDDDFETVEEYDEAAQLRRRSRRAIAGEGETAVERYDYYLPGEARIARGRLKSVQGAVSLHYAYEEAPGGSDRILITDPDRNTVTTIERDAAGRATRRAVTQGPRILSEETFSYDANGQITKIVRPQDGLGDVVTEIGYDVMQREIRVSTSGAAVDGTASTVVRTTTWDLRNRTVTRTDPHVEGQAHAKDITRLDSLGRVAEVRREAAAGGAYTVRRHGYDRQGLLSYETDGVRFAQVRVHDPFGREVVQVDSRKQRHETSWTEWNEAKSQKQLDAEANVVGRSQTIYTRNGAVRAVNEELIGGSQYRSTRFGWSSGGRETSVRVGALSSIDAPLHPDTIVRLVENTYDAVGRMTDEKRGQSSGITGPFHEHGIYLHTTTDYSGPLPAAEHVREPRAGMNLTTVHARDGLGRPETTIAPGGYQVTRTFDQAGNVLTSATSNHALPSQAKYDARGLVTEATHPDGTAIRYRYDALGNLIRYEDETDQSSHATRYETDGLGRVVKTRYPDGTCEMTVFENGSGAVLATRDRAGQWLTHLWGGYLLEALQLGPVGPPSECDQPAPASAPEPVSMLYDYVYDAANRLTKIRGREATVEWTDFDMAGRPHTTRSIRYRNRSGLDDEDVLDVHTQRHVWNVFGERERYRLPIPGTTIPQTAADSTRWRSWIEETHDSVGNVISQKAVRTEASAPVGPLISQAFARGIGRFAQRERGPVRTDYGYAEPEATPSAPDVPATAPAPGPQSGLLGRVEFWKDKPIAGSVITRDFARRIAREEMVGTRGRESRYSFDDRDRIRESVLGALTGGTNAPTITEDLQAPDFRESRTVQRFTAAERDTIGPAAARSIELPSFSATPNAANQIQTVDLDGVLPVDLTFAFEGGRRKRDGTWETKFDAFGRLVQVTRIAPLADAPNRFEYDYNALDRVVARRVCTNTNDQPCVLETRTNVLARDGLPAHTTFVWDPITDRLVSIFEAGTSVGAGVGEYAGLQRQYIHGAAAYDDPLVAITPDATFHPLTDEAGTGNLIAVLRDDGTLAERVLYGDAWGASPKYLHGPVVQRIARKTTKNVQGEITEVALSVNLSDAIDTNTVAAGTTLRAVRSAGAVTSTIEPSIDPNDPHTLRWSLSGADWLALSSNAREIEVVITQDLRAIGWGATPVMRTAEWLRTMKGFPSTDAEPVLARESVASIESNAQEVLLEVRDLYLVASSESRTKVLTGFKAYPFRDPATGLVYARARWYDSETGTFLTPDPMSYEDSSNLYAFCANDPINCSDPTGTIGFGPIEQYVMGRLGEKYVRDERFRNTTDDVMYAVGETLANPYVQGTLQIAGGCSEAALGIGAVWTGLGTVPGAAAALHGGDICIAGVRTVFTGRAHESYFDQAAVYGLQKAGLSEVDARSITLGLNIAVSGYGSAGSTRAIRQTFAFDDVAEAAAQGLNEGAAQAVIELAPQRFSIVYIGKVPDLRGVRPELTLLPELPNLGTPKANYYQNMSVLRRKLREGYEVFDRSKFRLNTDPDPTPRNPSRTIGQSFLGAERNQLANRALRLNPLTGRYE